MSHLNWKELSWFKKISLISVNISALYLFLPATFLAPAAAFIIHPFLSLVVTLFIALFSWRYLVWMNRKPDSLPIHIAPLTAFLMLSIMSGLFICSGYFYEALYLKSRIGLCATGYLWVGYNLWGHMLHYFSKPLMEKLWNPPLNRQ